jgi:hypothetical protein
MIPEVEEALQRAAAELTWHVADGDYECRRTARALIELGVTLALGAAESACAGAARPADCAKRIRAIAVASVLEGK